MPVDTAKLVVSAVITHNDKVLILEEPNDDGVMHYNLPGGHVEPGETLYEAFCREAREEAGLEVVPQHFLGVVANTWTTNHSVRFFFSAEAKISTVVAEEGVHIQWMTRDEVAALADERCVFGIKRAIEKFFSKNTLPSDAITMRKLGEEFDWSPKNEKT